MPCRQLCPVSYVHSLARRQSVPLVFLAWKCTLHTHTRSQASCVPTDADRCQSNKTQQRFPASAETG